VVYVIVFVPPAKYIHFTIFIMIMYIFQKVDFDFFYFTKVVSHVYYGKIKQTVYLDCRLHVTGLFI
jgi:hypothetical protein